VKNYKTVRGQKRPADKEGKMEEEDKNKKSLSREETMEAEEINLRGFGLALVIAIIGWRGLIFLLPS